MTFAGSTLVSMRLLSLHFTRTCSISSGINISATGILLIYRGDQQAFTDHHLILYPAGKVILREGESQRHTVQAVVQGSFHVLAVNVGQQQVAQL